jgi:hypothetical protein
MSNSANDDGVVRITSDPQGAKGSIEWIIQHVNWLGDTPAANQNQSTKIMSPIFVCCGHRWLFQLAPAYKEKDEVDEKKEKVMTSIHLFLAPEELKDVTAVSGFAISGDSINDRCPVKAERRIFKGQGSLGWVLKNYEVILVHGWNVH